MDGLGSYIVYKRPDTRELVRIFCPAAPETPQCQGLRDKERASLRSTYGRDVPIWVEDVGGEQYLDFAPILFGAILGVLTGVILNAIDQQTKREV